MSLYPVYGKELDVLIRDINKFYQSEGTTLKEYLR
jgi:hypothetical protein